jgi:integrase
MLKLVLRPKSPCWIIRGRVTIGGARIEESTGTPERRIAEEIFAKRAHEIHREGLYGRAATATFAHAAASYLEGGGSKRFLAPALDYFAGTMLTKVDQDAIERGARKVYPDAGPATRNRQFFTPVAAVLRHAAEHGMCAMPMIKRPKQPKGRIRWLTIGEADRLIEEYWDRALITFLFFTGARAGEALWLDWRDVDLARAHVTFRDTKNGTDRGMPLHPRVVAALANLPHREGEVFRRPDGLPYERPRGGEDHSAGTRIKTAFTGACRRAGIPDFHPHDCRHTWATWHYAANRDLGALMRLGGWKSEKMVLRYAHVNVGELAHTIEMLPGGNWGDEQTARRKTA